MSIVQERFKAAAMAANSTATLTGRELGGFLATVAGTLDVDDVDGTAIVDALPVTAGIFYPLPMLINKPGATVTLSGGAAGTLFA